MPDSPRGLGTGPASPSIFAPGYGKIIPELRVGEEKRLAPQAPRITGLQILRRQGGNPFPARDHGGGRPQRLREEQHRRLAPLGPGRAEPAQPARHQDGRHHLRGERHPEASGPRRGGVGPGQQRRLSAGGVQRGFGGAPALPLRRERVPDQQVPGQAARYPGDVPRHGPRQGGLFRDRAGQDRRDPLGQGRGEAGDLRGSRRGRQIQAQKGRGHAAPGGDRGQPGPGHGSPGRDREPARPLAGPGHPGGKEPAVPRRNWRGSI